MSAWVGLRSKKQFTKLAISPCPLKLNSCLQSVGSSSLWSLLRSKQLCSAHWNNFAITWICFGDNFESTLKCVAFQAAGLCSLPRGQPRLSPQAHPPLPPAPIRLQCKPTLFILSMCYWNFPLEHFARCDVQIPSGMTLEYTSYLWHCVRTRLVELLIMWSGHCTDQQVWSLLVPATPPLSSSLASHTHSFPIPFLSAIITAAIFINVPLLIRWGWKWWLCRQSLQPMHYRLRPIERRQ